nr:DUF4157 domain-containing protein [uncultured Fibrobacter sp.]
MNTMYTQKKSTVQKNSSPIAASVLDLSSQSEALQRKADMANNATQRAEAPRPNNTGMPDNLKSGIESLSGFSMDDVRVHYNSSKPATVQALAYTQGTDIHVAPGQEKHLPHEAWHVAQQMAGRVSPTTNINSMPVNDNAGLEHEADVMGEKAVQCFTKKNEDGLLRLNNSHKQVSQLLSFNYQATSSTPFEHIKVYNFGALCALLFDSDTIQGKVMINGETHSRAHFLKRLERLLKLELDRSGSIYHDVPIGDLSTIEAVAERIKALQTVKSKKSEVVYVPRGCDREFVLAIAPILPRSQGIHSLPDIDSTDAKPANTFAEVNKNSPTFGTKYTIGGLKHCSGGRGRSVEFTTAFFTENHLYALGHHCDEFGQVRYEITYVNTDVEGNPFVLGHIYALT